jgi:hypothetical protein
VAAKLEKITGDESVLFQTDWDRPALAGALGWNMRGRTCSHDSTDGTVTCQECGKTANEFIADATEWLDDRDGDTFQNTSGDDYILSALGEY